MKISIALFLFLIMLSSCSLNHETDASALARELDSILVEDQKYREEYSNAVKAGADRSADEVQTIQDKMFKADNSNLARVQEIISVLKIYPGKSLVGENASKAVMMVLQHAPEEIQIKYTDLIMDAAKNGELDRHLAAMYQDRALMHQGLPQIYGSQIMTRFRTDSATGVRNDTTFLWPIADTTRIDSLRQRYGFGPLEEYLNQHNLSRFGNPPMSKQ